MKDLNVNKLDDLCYNCCWYLECKTHLENLSADKQWMICPAGDEFEHVIDYFKNHSLEFIQKEKSILMLKMVL